MDCAVTYTVGAIPRREIRRWLQRHGATYTEDKGWFDSQFVVSGSNELHRRFREDVRAAYGLPG